MAALNTITTRITITTGTIMITIDMMTIVITMNTITIISRSFNCAHRSFFAKIRWEKKKEHTRPRRRRTTRGTSGFADTYVEPFNMGSTSTQGMPLWLLRAGAPNNGSGYWGNNITSAATFYITKDKGTGANFH